MRAAALLSLALLAACAPAITPPQAVTVTMAGAAVRLDLAGELEADRASIRSWVEEGVQAVAAYYGRPPVDSLTVRVDAAARPGVHGGKSFGYPRALIRMNVGAGTSPAQFRNDWMMAHELVHLTFPSLPDAQIWAQEGLATYVEPLARHQAGQLAALKVWRDLLDGIPKGAAALSHAGLDGNDAWAAIYWGGAWFWLQADLAIRAHTGDRQGLREALRAILAAGGDSSVTWTLPAALREGDRAVGAPVLAGLYERLRSGRQSIDVQTLWRDLGIAPAGDTGVRFDDTAPLAHRRRAIAG